MPWGDTYVWEENPGLGPAQAAIAGARERVQGTKSAGNRWWRSILQGALKGDFSGVADPSTISAAAEQREAEAGSGMSLEELNNPDLARQRLELKKDKIDERAGINRYNYVNAALQGAAGGNAGFALDKMNADVNLSLQESENELAAREGRIKKGFGSAVIGGLIGGAGAASGLGWKPFG